MVSATLATGFSRNRYARIRLVDTGVLTPSDHARAVDRIPFNVIVEPLYFGVLPASTAPTLAFILALILATATLVPTAISWADTIALDLRTRQKAD